MARFIVSHRLAGKRDRAVSQAALNDSVSSFEAFADVEKDTAPDSEQERRVLHIEADAVEIQSRRAEFGQDVLIEQEVLRYPAVALPAAAGVTITLQGLQPPAAGIGALFEATILGGGKPLQGASVTFILASLSGGAGTNMASKTGQDGKISFAYNSSLYIPNLLLIEPLNGFWQGWQVSPQTNSTYDLPALPKAGPLGWWHNVQGMLTAAPERGAGIKVGVVDTGVGPHPYLTHVQRLGSVINGVEDENPDATNDSGTHGTHVCGIIGARPAKESGDYEGIAPAADLMCLRVFPPNAGANQGDIAEAIDQLSLKGADLINLSLGGPDPSDIEHDALLAALDVGSLCVCAAGNGYSHPLYYPAAYPETVSVVALGLIGSAPAGTEAANCMPSQPSLFGPNGLYVGNFNNAGLTLVCSASGVGIISTVPVRNSVPAPYLDMSGTSMASPMACASLATLLSHDQTYRSLPRDITRAQRASATLLASLKQLGMNPMYVGRGLSQGWPS